jgi:phosphatidylinositol glycan class Q protein
LNFEIPNNLRIFHLMLQSPCRHRIYTSKYGHMSANLVQANKPQSVPLTFRAMFHQYFQLGQRIRKHYLSPRVLMCLATGKFVPPIHRKNLYSLQYSMLPARRASIMDMWHALTAQVAPKIPIYPELKMSGRRLNGNGRRYGH